MNVTTRIAQRVRHQARSRLLQVLRVESLTPRLRRITVGGEQLAGFTSAAFDDHVKLFLPAPGAERPVMPSLGPDGPVWPAGDRPVMRDYTPRRYDPQSGELTLEFVVHDHGPASDWARAAAPGQWIGVGGPRGSLLIPDDYAAYLLAGDETALPAIARRLEEMAPGLQALVFIEAAGPEEQRYLPTAANAAVTWLFRNGAQPGTTTLLGDAISAARLPDADMHGWIAAEIQTARAIRRHLTEDRGHDRADIRAAGYWRMGAAGVHERVED